MKSVIPKKIILGLMLLLPNVVAAETFTMKNMGNNNFDNSNFPFFSSAKYPQSALNINIFLQHYYFEQPLKEKDFSSKLLSPFRNTENHRRVFSFYDEPIVHEKTNYITVKISGDACGAYCEGRTETFIFDKYTGQLITLVDLLSPSGTIALEAKVRADNLKRIKPYIINKPDNNADEYIIGEYDLYNYCYQSRFKDDYDNIDKDTSFSLSDNQLTVQFGRCSNHAARALDEIGNFENTFSLKELNQYLSEDGKQYLSNNKYSLSSIKTPYKVYHGQISGKYPITVLHAKYGGWYYWYDKYGKPITLHKSKCNDKNKKCFTESNYDNKENKWIYTAEWNIREKNRTFSGSFSRSSDGKMMNITFN